MRVLRFILLAGRPYGFYFGGLLLALFITSLDANVRPYLVKLLIDSVTGVKQENIWVIFFIFSAFQLIAWGGWYLNSRSSIPFYSRFRYHIMTLLTQRISSYSYSFFQNYLSGTIAAKINDVVSLTPNLIFTIANQFIYFILGIIITLFFLAQVHIVFALGLLCWVALFLGLAYVGMRKVDPLTSDYAEAKAKLGGHVTDYFGNILNVKCFATLGHELREFNQEGQDFITKVERQGHFLANFYLFQGSIESIYVIGFVIALIYLHQIGLVTPGDFALVFMLNHRIIDKLFQLSFQLQEFVTNWGTVNQALKILELPLEIQDRPDAKSLVITKGEIVFDRVHFHYKDTEPLFQDKSVTIAPGQKVGLVGYSGSGKSTFVNLILRLFDVTSGHIRIDEQDIREVAQDSLRNVVGMIPQDPSLFHRSLLENIRYGQLDATDEEVIEASKRAHAHEFIAALPQGYESLVGERGVKLSGGQRQRIAIARAILKDAPILILDEATSQLDSVTESFIQESLWKVMQGKTTIVIAHRLSTLLHMDRILVFDHGKIVEEGTHQKLLAQTGLYKTLWDAQVGGFLADQRDDIVRMNQEQI